MKRSFPRGVDGRSVKQLLKVAGSPSRATRIDAISTNLLGLPYQTDPLTGSAKSPEIFTAAVNSFDCVTYVETVLALSAASDVETFLSTLRRIRYASGKIDWLTRNHYMTGWIRNNLQAGLIRRVAGLRGTVEKDKLLNVVPGLPSRRSKFACLAKTEFLRQREKVRTGDVVFFASTKKNLDVFHCGIAVNNGKGLLLRHASRSQGQVVEQNFEEFLHRNRMAGVIVVRPAEVD
jgi:hypothetical protein